MSTVTTIKEKMDLLAAKADQLAPVRQAALKAFNNFGLPAPKHEEWKYTRIGNVFNLPLQWAPDQVDAVTAEDLKPFLLPGHEEANVLVFVNGVYASALSVIRSASIECMSLEAAMDSGYAELVAANLGHSGKYLTDGINALSTASLRGGVFLTVKRSKDAEHPLFVYNITDARQVNMLSQPRVLLHLAENAGLQMMETYGTIGSQESFTNQVMEVVVEKDARFEYYKIQNDAAHASQVSTTHIRQTGKSFVHAVTISLNGAIVRNNLNLVMEAEYCDSHMYGLYCMQGKSHIDNHTIVDNVMPHCESNEFYKGIMGDASTGVFNGKIFVRQDAQKTNAFQSNKNVLISDDASVNTKPQLEIFADDVKCSHGCTIGRLDEDGIFYLRSRGIPDQVAKSLLLHSFAMDILEQIKPEPLRNYVDRLVSERLAYEME
ncbi:Fe-S cluster assembly protein SufD [Flavihumibacter stibioxidans]|uniref:Fe-S cluster assembly protein SufD n=1 Tax=Flavihumibacter stibioxidans TaxID=1834163 RepID=A0ABR7M8P8_9BACT|nr:Fe-S cluster assembly protein SufD [Flavihumibacter stibioxidans]MBC6490988.1 Fe-S cluster assembly protein SufD [Flavihumibacter stibioxidans]